MTDLRKAAEMAVDYIVEALARHDEAYERHPSAEHARQVIVNDLEALRQALSQPDEEELLKQGWRKCAVGQRTTQYCGMAEPVAQWYDGYNKGFDAGKTLTAPPKREWVGLTAHDKAVLIDQMWNQAESFEQFMDSIDKFLKWKNT